MITSPLKNIEYSFSLYRSLKGPVDDRIDHAHKKLSRNMLCNILQRGAFKPRL